MLRALIRAGNRRGRELEALFDTIQTGGNHGGHGEVGVHVGAGAAGLQPGGLGAAGNHAKTRGAVVQAPGRLDRGPESIDQALVAVDGGPDQGGEFHHAGDLAGEVALEQFAHLARGLRVIEQIGLAVAVMVREALVNMPAATRQLLMRLGHEAGHDAKTGANFLGTGLEQNRAVSLRQRFAKTNGGLVDTGAGLGVQAFNRHAKGQHLVHDGVEEFPVLVHAQQ